MTSSSSSTCTTDVIRPRWLRTRRAVTMRRCATLEQHWHNGPGERAKPYPLTTFVAPEQGFLRRADRIRTCDLLTPSHTASYFSAHVTSTFVTASGQRWRSGRVTAGRRPCQIGAGLVRSLMPTVSPKRTGQLQTRLVRPRPLGPGRPRRSSERIPLHRSAGASRSRVVRRPS